MTPLFLFLWMLIIPCFLCQEYNNQTNSIGSIPANETIITDDRPFDETHLSFAILFLALVPTCFVLSGVYVVYKRHFPLLPLKASQLNPEILKDLEMSKSMMTHDSLPQDFNQSYLNKPTLSTLASSDDLEQSNHDPFEAFKPKKKDSFSFHWNQIFFWTKKQKENSQQYVEIPLKKTNGHLNQYLELTLATPLQDNPSPDLEPSLVPVNYNLRI